MHPYHFTPHVTTPLLMINGRYDTMFPYQSAQVPFLEDLGSTNKKHVTLDSGHNPPLDKVVEETDKWLRELFGPP